MVRFPGHPGGLRTGRHPEVSATSELMEAVKKTTGDARKAWRSMQENTMRGTPQADGGVETGSFRKMTEAKRTDEDEEGKAGESKEEERGIRHTLAATY
ncbi:hypothetical protein NDU88_000373 [Pleurodeles waltl]|uniref:Uncharacterized protein n=1 Tax=Pleurodeles waltl TaxID=8319 RepID=A0AAV7S4D3_PLEWA|nr:hypothetical protein NDU88_000373 [Pleurodeles waltl]